MFLLNYIVALTFQWKIINLFVGLSSDPGGQSENITLSIIYIFSRQKFYQIFEISWHCQLDKLADLLNRDLRISRTPRIHLVDWDKMFLETDNKINFGSKYDDTRVLVVANEKTTAS